jgi:hypothetical protein
MDVRETKNSYKILVGKPQGRKLYGRPRRRWEGNITMDIREVVCKADNLIQLAQETVQ